MEIRLANLKDIDILLKYDKHISKHELKNSIDLGRVYIIQNNNIFIGWLRYNMFWDNTPFMNLLYIMEEHQGNGYGKVLVEYWEKEMKKLGYKYVMTSTPSNEYSQHFYNKLGYIAIGGFIILSDPYEIIMGKRI